MIEGLRLRGPRLRLKHLDGIRGQLAATLNRDAGAYLDETLKMPLAASSALPASSLPPEDIGELHLRLRGHLVHRQSG